MATLPTAPAQTRRTYWNPRRKEASAAYAYLAPASILLLVFVVLPFLFVVYLSMHNWNLVNPNPPFIGAKNYISLLHSPSFWHSLLVTAYFIAGTVPTQLILALILALMLSGRLRLKGLFRLGIFAPYVTPVVATSIVWLWIFNPTYGLLNYFLNLLHIGGVGWLTDPNWAMPGVIIYSIWHELGFSVVIYLSAISNLPQDFREAARIDGANFWIEFRHIILPLVSPTTYFLLIINSIAAFKVFTQIYTLTGGGPVTATTTTGYYLYQYAFQYFNIGYASAIAVAIFVIILALTLIQMLVARRRVHYQ